MTDPIPPIIPLVSDARYAEIAKRLYPITPGLAGSDYSHQQVRRIAAVRALKEFEPDVRDEIASLLEKIRVMEEVGNTMRRIISVSYSTIPSDIEKLIRRWDAALSASPVSTIPDANKPTPIIDPVKPWNPGDFPAP